MIDRETASVQGEGRKLCDEYIVGAGVWGGTYCKLLAGHDGSHSMHYPPETESTAPAQSDEAERWWIVVFPEGHVEGRTKPLPHGPRRFGVTEVEVMPVSDLPRLLAEAMAEKRHAERVIAVERDEALRENKRLRELYENAVGNRERFGWTIDHLLECEEALRAVEQHAAEARAEGEAAMFDKIVAWLRVHSVWSIGHPPVADDLVAHFSSEANNGE